MWKPFRFEGNLYVGLISTPDDWEKVKNAYKGHFTIEELLKAQIHGEKFEFDVPYQGPDRFGFYQEYDGDKTLKEFFDENEMEP